ncbi:hypothetical protein EXN66_Car012302 [Channa argus]|uniref:Uncharacterized protein n=1 Tax=Channa argus TaxID=215402 RepID=A0A6G1Q2K4_CHAAH|nr:hypothetical protein EXN66_Car012302 [Channa argus]
MNGENPTPPQNRKIPFHFLTPCNSNSMYDIYGLFDTSVHSDFDRPPGIGQQMINISKVTYFLTLSLISGLHVALKVLHITEGLLRKANTSAANLGQSPSSRGIM